MTEAGQPEAKSGWLGRLVLVLLAVPVFIALCELGLWALDLGRNAWSSDLSRGFDPAARLMVPDRSERGAWRTHIYGDLELERVVPARDERIRVVLFGGSNTQLFPEQVLEQRLNDSAAADGERDAERDRGWEHGFEVVNLGRQGYGSRRVLALLEQAMVLEPDVVVIYSGHNEFVELGFERELASAWDHSWEQASAESLSKLRMFGVLVDAMNPLGMPEPITRPDHAARQLRWDETVQRYEAFEANLEAMCAAARSAGARVLVVTPVSNMLSPPLVFGDVGQHQQAFDALRQRALGRIPSECRQALRPPVRLRVVDWYSAPQDAEPGEQLSPNWEAPLLRPLLGPLEYAPASEEPKADSVEGAHWPRPDGWNPDVRAVLETMSAYAAPELDARTLRWLSEARLALLEALELVPDSPIAWFDLGLVAWLQGDAALAVRAFESAGRFDRSPSSANVTIYAAVRAVASRVEGVQLVDAAALFGQRSPDGVVGYEVLMDACHLQPGARVVLMEDLARAIRQPQPLEPVDGLGR